MEIGNADNTGDSDPISARLDDLEKRVRALENTIQHDHEVLEHDHELLERLDSDVHKEESGPVGL